MKEKLLSLSAVIFLLAISFWLFWMPEKGEKSPERISGAYEALNFWSYQRAYPNKAIPDVAHYAAFEYAQKNLQRSPGGQLAAVDPWKEIGPHNLGGRTLAIVFNPQNPNTVYAGSASGGLWRSHSGGRGPDAWDYIPTGFPVLGVSSIAFAPGDSNTIYIGTGEVYNYQNAGTGAAYRSTRGTYGIGILKTTDGGASWSKSLDWAYNQTRGVWAVKVNPLNPNTVWAATTEGTYKSIDGGASWVQKHNVIMANDLVINPADTNIVVVGCGNFGSTGHGIYRTIDGGETWSKQTVGLPPTFGGKAHLSIYEADPGIVYASFGNGFGNGNPPNASWLCRSTDGGDTWNIETTLDYSKWQGWFSHDVAVNPTNSDEVFAIGIEIYKSTNGGGNLAQISTTGWFSGRIPPEGPEGPPSYTHADHHDIVYHPTDPNIVYFGTDGGVFRTTDGGQTFESCNGGYQTGQFYNGFASAATDSLLSIGGLQDNSTAIYDGQLAWFVHLIGGDGAWAAIDPTDENIMYGSWQVLNVLKSTNKGTSFFNIPVPGSNRITVFIAPYVVATDNPQILYAGRDIVYKSTNGGSNWTQTTTSALDGNPVFSMAVSPQNSNVVYVGTAPFITNRGVFHTLNGGATWQNITGSLPNRFPTDLTVDATDEATVYITFSGFGTSHVYKSTDYGTNWVDVGSSLPDVPANAVVVDPDSPQHVYVGNDLGVYVSLDGGATWSEFNEGFPGAILAMDLSISPLNRKLRVATHGNGAYERDLVDPVGIAGEEPLPDGFALKQNYPNPFNPETTIPYSLSKPAQVTLKIYNTLGQEVQTLLDKQFKNPGDYRVVWDGRDYSGKKAASGVYIYRLYVDKFVSAKRMVLTK
jgi:photosystem II stability/assembly factor-like uncharacterized protein